MTKIINMYGGPGVGKSTAATGVFSQLKSAGVNCEYVSEYAKDIVWEQTNALLDNQIHIFAEQFRRQFRLVGKVDYVITDSPLILSCVYFDHWFRKRNTKMFDDAYCELTKKYFLESFRQFDNINWVIHRAKEYNPKGRMQSLDEAKQIDQEVQNYLLKNWIPYEVTDSKFAVQDVYNSVMGLPKRIETPSEIQQNKPPEKKRSWWRG